MKNRLFSLLLLTCGLSAIAQHQYEAVDARNGAKDLVGHFPSEKLTEEPYSDWFSAFYDYHQPDTARIASFSPGLKQHHILLFMGTWCSDSQREVPAVMKILEVADFPKDQLKIVGVFDRGPNYKTSPNGEEWGLQITNVPTIIFLKNGKEVNRIVESPVESLEQDMARIISGEEYRPNYAPE